MSDNKLPNKNAPKTPKVAPKVANKPSSATAPKVAPKTNASNKVVSKTAPKTTASNKVTSKSDATKPATTTASKVSPTTSKANPIAPKENLVTEKVENKPENIKSNKSAIKTNPIRPQTKAVDASNVAVKADDGDKKKKRRRLLLLLLLLLVFVSSIGLAIYFVSKNAPTPEIKFSIQILSSDVKTEYVDENDHTVNKIKFMPGGDPIEGNLKIKIINDNGTNTTSGNVFLRFKIDIVVDDNNYFNFFDPILNEGYEGEMWTCGDKTLTEYDRGKSFDGYYYYNTKCYGGEEIEVFNRIDFVGERNNNILNGKEGNIIFTVEILEGDHSAINDNWQTAPTTWRRKVR